MSVTTGTTMIVLNYSDALRKLSRGELTAEELATGIYYLDVVAEPFVHDFDKFLTVARIDSEVSLEVFERSHQLLREAVTAAEADNRLAWCHNIGNEGLRWFVLNDMLASKGLPQIDERGYPGPGLPGFEPARIDNLYRFSLNEAAAKQELPYRAI